MSKFKIGDKVRVVSFIANGYRGKYKEGDMCEVLKTSFEDVLLKGDTEHGGCHVSNRFLELVVPNSITIKVGDMVKVIRSKDHMYNTYSYEGIHNYGSTGKVASIDSTSVVLEGDDYYCLPLSCVELVEPPVQYKDKPPTHPDIYVIDEWKLGASIQRLGTFKDLWYNISGCPEMNVDYRYRVDPDCIIPEISPRQLEIDKLKLQAQELLAQVDKLQSMDKGE